MMDLKAHICQLPEGGVSVMFVSGKGRRAFLDIYDPGEMVAATSNANDPEGNPEIWEIENTSSGLARTFERIFGFLGKED